VCFEKKEKMKKRMEDHIDSMEQESKRSKSSDEEGKAVIRLLDWWFYGIDVQSQQRQNKKMESYSEAARSRWFANGAGV
jgi:hypothetical protein